MPPAKSLSEQERDKALKKILATEKADMTKSLLIISGVMAALLITAGVLDYMETVVLPFDPIDYIIIALLVLIGPYGFYASTKERNIREIERRLPDFLRDVAEAGRFGMTLADAIVVASSGRYGRLTPEIKKMAAQIEWGVPASEAIRLFSERVKTPLVTRMTSIIMKANDAGGNVADVLTMVSHDAKETILTQEERGVTMQTYVLVVYIAYFVFIVTVIILQMQFLPKMVEAGQSVSESAGDEMGDIQGVSINVDIIPAVSFIFVLAVVVHAVGDGILAGVISNGSIPMGMRHSFIMLLIGFILLRLVFG